MDNEIKVTVENGVKELVIREGAASFIVNPVQMKASGTIETAQNYWELRKKTHMKDKCFVVYDTTRLFVNLYCDENNPIGSQAFGSLIKNPELEGLGINSNKGYTLTDLRNKLKFMRTYFKELDAYTVLLGNLAKFSASVSSQIEKETSERGNKKENFEVKVDSNLALDFVLSMPVYKGLPKSDFKVDICFDIREKNIEVWMESVELRDLQIQIAEDLIGKQIIYFENEGVVTIEQ